MKISAVFVAVTAALIAVLALTPFAKSAETLFLKLAYGAKSFHKAPEIVLVNIDERALSKFGPWPWRAADISLLLNSLTATRPSLIAMTDEVTTAVFGAEGKPSLRAEMPPTSAGFSLLSSLSDLPVVDNSKAALPPISQPDDSIQRLAFQASPENDSQIPSVVAIKREQPPQSMRANYSEGFSTILAGPDEIVVSQPLAVRFKGLILPSLAVSTVSKWLGFTPLIAESSDQKISGLKIGELEIGTGPTLEIALSLRGPSGTFPGVSAEEIMSGKTSPEVFSGRLAILSVTSGPKAQGHLTTLGKMTDAEIHANIIDNVLHARPMVVLTSGIYGALFILAFVLAFVASISIPHLGRTIASMIAIIAISWGAGIFALYSRGVWLPVIETTAAIISAAATFIVWRIFKYDAPRKKLSDDFWWRLDPASISELIVSRATPDIPSLCEVTALCFDMRGYGRVVESLDEARVISFTRELRSIVQGIIVRHGGFINTWTGDECRAIFGAPLKITEPKLRACLAALDVHRELSSQPKWKDTYGLSAAAIAIGIQTGLAASGRPGHAYEIIGPAVEASARLSSMSRLYRTWALLGESTAADVLSEFEFRRMDNAILYGSQSAEGIYELIGEAGSLLPASRGFGEAMGAYLAGDFEKAKELFERILKFHPEDGPSRLFLRRAVFLAAHRPAKWDGVWKF